MAELSAAEINGLPDSAFAYIEPGGTKDEDGKTTPRALRHYPIPDEAHAQNALARANAVIADDSSDDDAKSVAKKALPKIEAALAKFNKSEDDGKRSVVRRQPKKGRERHRAVPMLPEVRHLAAHNLEIRENEADASGDTVVVQGMWCRYNVGYVVYDAFGEFEERMRPGVCGDLMGRADVRFLVDHNPSMILARTKSGTLTLSDSDDGALMRATVDLRDSDARNLIVRLERGDVSQMSCGFVVARDEWNDSYDQRDVILFRDLLDVSSVTYPASPTTDIDVARRMVLGIPVESRARLRKMVVDTRAGKVLSAQNAGRIKDVVGTLGELLKDAGVNAEPDVEDVETVNADGDDGGTVAIGEDGARSEDGSEETRGVQRRDSASYSDLEQQVHGALVDHLQDRGVANPDLCLEDCGDDWAVFTLWSTCQSFKITFERGDDGSVMFGDYDAVDRVTSWEPVAERSGEDDVDATDGSETRSNYIRLRVNVGKRRL